MNAIIWEKKIVMTTTEAKAAGKFGTKEFDELGSLMERFPTFTIEVVKPAKTKSKFKGMNTDYMVAYIDSHNEANRAEYKKEFNLLRGRDEEGNRIPGAPVATIGELQQWFILKYPEVEKTFDDFEKLLKETKSAAKEAKAEKAKKAKAEKAKAA